MLSKLHFKRKICSTVLCVCVCFLFLCVCVCGWEGEAFYTNQRFETRSASITVVGGKYRKRFGTKRQLKRVEPQLCGLIFLC